MANSNISIKRERLMKLAEKLCTNKILYLQAPGGYGKTVFAGQWLKNNSKCQTATVRFDEYDNNIGHCCRKLKRMLSEMFPDDHKIKMFTEHPAFDSAPIDFLIRAIDDLPAVNPIRVVIDDLHKIEVPEIQQFLVTIFIRLPMYTKILVLSRSAPPDAFGEIYLKNDLSLISWDNLKFTTDEIQKLYNGHGVDITKNEAEYVLKQTDGWPIGINALLLSGNSTPAEDITQDQLERFIKNQVWKSWNSRTRNFMLKTSIEEELTGDLCDFLTGESDSASILDQLYTEGAFLRKQENGVYCFHDLFRNFLHKQLEEKTEEYRETQWRLAGKWYLQQKDFYHAVERFSQIKDYDNIARCFDLLESMDRAGFDAIQVMGAVQNSLDKNITDKYPFLCTCWRLPQEMRVRLINLFILPISIT